LKFERRISLAFLGEEETIVYFFIVVFWSQLFFFIGGTRQTDKNAKYEDREPELRHTLCARLAWHESKQ
jgi:hypothetical protein